MSVEKVGCVVVGGGVIGLACARALASTKRCGPILVLEASSYLGSETSSRNSGVIHASLYYQPHTLKTKFCIEGRKLLYDYCVERGLPHRRCGKLLVATNEDESRMLRHKILATARQNGLTEAECRMISAAEARAMEPNVSCTEALYSQVTGAVDTAAFIQALEADLCNSKPEPVTIALNCRVNSGHIGKHKEITLHTSLGDISCDFLVNAAGLNANAVASSVAGYPLDALPMRTYFAKGNYFRLNMSSTNGSLFHHHIYPVPVDGGLGIHATVDTHGTIRFGPDVQWIMSPSSQRRLGEPNKLWWNRLESPSAEGMYDVSEDRAPLFYAAIRKYCPSLPDDSLLPDYAGIRPKLNGPGEPAADFCIVQDPRVPQIVTLLGFESPGLTASLAIGRHIASLMR